MLNVDVNGQRGWYRIAIQAASYHGCENVVQILLELEADANALGGHHGNALQAASLEGHKNVVQKSGGLRR
jgi:hypothetical protein